MPITSMEIQQMMAQTNSGFAQNQAYAQGLTASNPLARYEHNLGAGIPGGNALVPGGAHASQNAPGMMQGGMGAMGAAGFGVTLGAAFGLLPRALDPFTQSIHTISGAYKTAGMGGAVGAGLGIGGAYLAVGQAATYMTSKIMQGAQEQAHSQGMFSANLGNSGISGMGGMGGMQGASDAIQGISSMGTSAGLGSNVNIGSVSNVMAMGMQGGQFRGVRGAEQFKQRLSQLTAEATAMANMLGSSIEEAAGQLQGIEQQFGLKGASAISFVGQMGAMQGASGLGVTAQMGQAQFGSGMFQSMGLGRAQGARYGVGLAQRVGGAVQMGAVGRNAMADIGGQEQATARFTQSAVRIFSGREGMRLLGAMMDENGELDTDMAFRIAQGGVSRKEVLKSYKKNVKGKAGRGMLLANRAELIGGFMEEFGPEGALSAVEGLNAGKADEEWRNLAMAGLTGKEMDVLRGLRGQSGNLRKQMYEAGRRGLAKSPMAGKSITDILGGMIDKVLQPIEDTFTGWGRDIHSAVSGFLDDLSRDLSGKGPAARGPSNQRLGNQLQGMGAAFKGGAMWAGYSSAYGTNSAFSANLDMLSSPQHLGSIMDASNNNMYSPMFGQGAPGAIPDQMTSGGGGGGGVDWDVMARGHQPTTALGGMVPSGVRYAQRGGDPSMLDNWGMFPSLWGAQEPGQMQQNILQGARLEGGLARAPGAARAMMRGSAFRAGRWDMMAQTGRMPTYSRALGNAMAVNRGGMYSKLGQMSRGPLGWAGSLLNQGGRQLLNFRNFMAEGQYLGKAGPQIAKLFQNTGWMKFGGRGLLGSISSSAGWMARGAGTAIGGASKLASKAFWPLMLLDPIAQVFAAGHTPGESGNYAEGITGEMGEALSAGGPLWGGEVTGYSPTGTGYDPNTTNEATYTFMGTQKGINRPTGSGNRVWIGASSGGMGSRSEISGETIHSQMWVDTEKVQPMMDFFTGGIHDTGNLQRIFGEQSDLSLMQNDLRSISQAYASNLNVAGALPGNKALDAISWQRLQEDTYIQTLRDASRTGGSGAQSVQSLNSNWTKVISYLGGKDLDASTRSNEIKRLMNLGGRNTSQVQDVLDKFKHANLTYRPGMTGKELEDFQKRLLAGTTAMVLSERYSEESDLQKLYERQMKEYRNMEKGALTADPDEGYDPFLGVLFQPSMLVMHGMHDPNTAGALDPRLEGIDLEDALLKVGLHQDDFKLGRQSEQNWFAFSIENPKHHGARRMKLTHAIGTKLRIQDKVRSGEFTGGAGLLKPLGLGQYGNDLGAQAIKGLIEQDSQLATSLIMAGMDPDADRRLFNELSTKYREATLAGITDETIKKLPKDARYQGKLITADNYRAYVDQELRLAMDDPEEMRLWLASWSTIAATNFQDARNKRGTTILTALRKEADSYYEFESSTGYSVKQAVQDGGGSDKAADVAQSIMDRLAKTIKTRSNDPAKQVDGLYGEIAQLNARFREEIQSMSGEDLIDLGKSLMDTANASGNSNAMEMAQIALGMGGFKSGRPKSSKKKPSSIKSMGQETARMLGLRGSDELALVGIGKGSTAKRIKEYIKINKELPLSSQLKLEDITRRKFVSMYPTMGTEGKEHVGRFGEKAGGDVSAAARFQLDVVNRRIWGTGEHEWWDPIDQEMKTSIDTRGLTDSDYNQADVLAAGNIGRELKGQSKGASKTDGHVSSIIANVEGLDGAIASFINRLTGK